MEINEKLNKEQQLNITTKAVDLGDGEIEVIVATEDVDRDGEILDLNGLDVKRYMKNPIVLWGHDYNMPPIGKTLELIKDEAGRLKAKVKFAVTQNPFAKMVYELVKDGFQNASSIGFIPKEGEFDESKNAFRYTKSEMLEFSMVPVPANPFALVTAKGYSEHTAKVVEKVFAGEMKASDVTEADIQPAESELTIKVSGNPETIQNLATALSTPNQNSMQSGETQGEQKSAVEPTKKVKRLIKRKVLVVK